MTGQVVAGAVQDILQVARASGIDMLDTAIAYGSSEQTLGALGVRDWKVITKLPPYEPADGEPTEPRQWVRAQVRASLQRLGVPALHGLLLHRPADLLGANGPPIHAAMLELKAAGLLGRIGISIYDPSEIPPLLERFAIDLLQAPFNVLDRRLETSGWLDRLLERGIEVHTRSAFLQGLLLMADSDRPHRFGRWAAVWKDWSEWLRAERIDPVVACLHFALSRPQISRVVLGVDSAAHLRQLIGAAQATAAVPPASLACEDLDLIEPSRWGRT